MNKDDTIKHLKNLLLDLNNRDISNYREIETKIISVIKNIFGETSDFYDDVLSIKNDLKLDSEIVANLIYNPNPCVNEKYEKSRLESYRTLLEQAIEAVDLYNYKKEEASHNSPTIINTQINGDVSNNGNFNTGTKGIINEHKNVQVDSETKHWFTKEVLKMILSFISGVVATVVAQWIMQILGWVK